MNILRKYSKKIASSLLTLAMLIGIIGTANVFAKTISLSGSYFQADEDKSYAIIAENGKAIFTDIGYYTSPLRAAIAYNSLNNSVAEEHAIVKMNNVETNKVNIFIHSLGENVKYVSENEGSVDYVFATADDKGEQQNFSIQLVTGETNKGVMTDNKGRYLYIGEENDRLLKTTSKDEAEVFTFVEAKYIEIDESVTIKNKETNRYLTFDGVEGNPALVNGDMSQGEITKNMKFNFVNNDMTQDGYNVVTFESVEHENMAMVSNDDVIKLKNDMRASGWESIIVVPNGDGTVSFKSSKNKQFYKLNKDNLQIEAKEGNTGKTDEEKFIIDSVPSVEERNKVTSITTSDVTDNTVHVSWNLVDEDVTKGIHTLYSGYKVVATPTVESGKATIISEETLRNTMNLTGLERGTQYTISVRTVLGDKTPFVESDDTVSIQTKNGPVPVLPTDVKCKEVDGGIQIDWKAVDNADEYDVYRAESAYAPSNQFVKINASSLTTTSFVDKNLNEKGRYFNYYKIIAKNANGESKLSDEFASLEKNMFGKNTIVFAPTDDMNVVDNIVEEIFNKANDYENDAQFNGDHYQIYFKKGDYKDTQCMNLGFYTSFNGLGKTPYDVELNNIAIPSYLPNGALGAGEYNATCNFWRSAENLSVIDTGKENGAARNGAMNERKYDFNWAVAQAAPLRRVYSTRPVSYDWNYGWASGGYVADCLFEGSFEDNGKQLGAGTHSGQQFYTRNSKITHDVFGCTLNAFYQGVDAPNLNSLDGKKLLGGNGKSNWSIPGANVDGTNLASQQIVTNIETTKKISEKPFLYLDDDGEYKVFVPATRQNVKGISWSKDNMGEGKSIPLSEFYIAKPTDTATIINEQINNGKHIYFTPGIYHAETPILVNKANTILLGSGMTTIIPDNADTAMEVGDVDGVRLAGLIFDAGAHSKYLLRVGTKGNNTSHADNPTYLQDIFFRVGGTTDKLTKADNALEINSNDVIGDHFWIWRADHGAGVTWEGNKSQHGLIVNGDNVTCYALFNEHFQSYDTLWNGENGSTYFYQNEKCYDPLDQEGWKSHNGTVNGYAAYKVSNDVKKHYAVGLGIYNVFIYTGGTADKLGDSSKVSIQMDNAIEVPNSKDVLIENACIQTFAKDDGALQKFNHIINGVGQAVASGVDQDNAVFGEGWSRKYLISYQNGSAVVGNSPIGKVDSNGNRVNGLFGELKTINNIPQPSDEEVANLGDKSALLDLYNDNVKRNEDKYTAASWKTFETALTNAKNVLKDSNATQDKVEQAYEALLNAVKGLQTNEDKTYSGGDVFETTTNSTTTTNTTHKNTENTTTSHKVTGGDVFVTEENIVENEDGTLEMTNPNPSATNTHTVEEIKYDIVLPIALSIIGGLALGTAGTFIIFNKKRKNDA